MYFSVFYDVKVESNILASKMDAMKKWLNFSSMLHYSVKDMYFWLFYDLKVESAILSSKTDAIKTPNVDACAVKIHFQKWNFPDLSASTKPKNVKLAFQKYKL